MQGAIQVPGFTFYVLKVSHSFTCTPRVHPLTEGAIPAFAFPPEAGPHDPDDLLLVRGGATDFERETAQF